MGLDLSSHFLKQAASRGPVVRGELQSLPFPDRRLDGVLAECVLSQQDDIPKVIGEFSRVLKEGGLLAVTDLFSKEGPGNRKGGGGCGRRAMEPAEMEMAFSSGGFRVEIFEDHSVLLRECVARLVWAGVLNGREVTSRCMGYGLWLAVRSTKSPTVGERR